MEHANSFDRGLDVERERKLQSYFAELNSGDAARVGQAFLAVQREDPTFRKDLFEMLSYSPEDHLELGQIFQDSAMRAVEEQSPTLSALVKEHYPTLEPGHSLGPYNIQKVLGEGGMGQVFLATRSDDTQLKVAIKLLKTNQIRALKRFRAESRILATLKHPNISHLIEAGQSERGPCWLAMEYVPGQPIGDYCDEQRLMLKQRILLFLRICDALDHAHRNLVIHRDIKPDNILVTPEGVPKLLDFGIAAILDPATGHQRTATVLHEAHMTPEYAAPEQFLGKPLSTACDVYSMGMVLFEMLTGKRAYHFKSRSWEVVLDTVCHAPITRPSTAVRQKAAKLPFATRDLRGDLDTIVLKALEKNPNRRYPSIRAMAEDLECYLDNKPISAQPPGFTYRVRKFVNRNRWPVALSCSVIALLMMFTVYALNQQLLVRQERDKALAERNSAQQVSSLLVSMFEEANPDQRRGRDIDIMEVLDAGRRRLLANSAKPHIRQNLLTVMGKIYRQMGAYDQAGALLDEAVVLKGSAESSLHARLELALTIELQGKYGEAMQMFDQLLMEIPKDPNDLLFNQIKRHQARLWRELGQYNSALAIYEEMADSREHEEEYYIRLGEKAKLHAYMGDFDRGIKLLEEVLVWQQSNYQEAHTQMVGTTSALVIYNLYQGELEKARSMEKLCERVVKQLYGENHFFMSEVYTNKANIHEAEGDMETASTYLKKALNMRRRLLGPEHPEIAQSLFDLASLNWRAGRLDESEKLMRQALDLTILTNGKDHPSTGTNYNDLGLLLDDQGKYEEAEEMFRKAIHLGRKFMGPQHPFVATFYNNLAQVLQHKQDYQGAEDLFKQSLHISMASFGEEHPSTYTYLHNLAMLYLEQDKDREALPILRETYEGFSQIFGENHPESAIALENIATAHLGMGDLEVAESYFHLALARKQDVFGSAHFSLGFCIANMASLRLKQGLFDEAVRLSESCLSILRNALPEGHYRISLAESVHGYALLRQGNLEGHPILAKAIEGLVKTRGLQDPFTCKAIEWQEEQWVMVPEL